MSLRGGSGQSLFAGLGIKSESGGSSFLSLLGSMSSGSGCGRLLRTETSIICGREVLVLVEASIVCGNEFLVLSTSIDCGCELVLLVVTCCIPLQMLLMSESAIVLLKAIWYGLSVLYKLGSKYGSSKYLSLVLRRGFYINTLCKSF